MAAPPGGALKVPALAPTPTPGSYADVTGRVVRLEVHRNWRDITPHVGTYALLKGHPYPVLLDPTPTVLGTGAGGELREGDIITVLAGHHEVCPISGEVEVWCAGVFRHAADSAQAHIARVAAATGLPL
jgi:hypothetical protein